MTTSETGSIVRHSIENALHDCSEAIGAVLALLEGPPASRQEIGRAIGLLYKHIYHLDAEIRSVRPNIKEVLVGEFTAVLEAQAEVTNQLDLLTDKGSDDSLSFVIWAGKMLDPLKRVKRALSQMEQARIENSRMKRA